LPAFLFLADRLTPDFPNSFVLQLGKFQRPILSFLLQLQKLDPIAQDLLLLLLTMKRFLDLATVHTRPSIVFFFPYSRMAPAFMSLADLVDFKFEFFPEGGVEGGVLLH
jgi:hypothetical protein